MTAAQSSARSRPSAALAVPNFAATGRKASLAVLIDNLITTKTAAEAACMKQGVAEKKFPFKERAPKVPGGTTAAVTIVVDGQATRHHSADWYYRSREEIAKHETGERKAKLLAEFSCQEKACQRAYPKELREAERVAKKALETWTAAEQALVNYRPSSAAEAVELLALAGRPAGRNQMPHLDIDEADLRCIVRNCANVLQKEFSH